MRPFVAVLSAAVLLAPVGRSAPFESLSHARSFDYVVPGVLQPLKQPKSMDCWATVATMLLNWKSQQTETVANTLASLGDPWKLYFDTNTGLPLQDATRFLQKAGLHAEPSANPTMNGWLALLRANGPLWISIGGMSDDGSQVWGHAMVLLGMHGDGTADGTTFDMIDPADGMQHSQTATEFAAVFERWANIANPKGWPLLNIEIVHL